MNLSVLSTTFRMTIPEGFAKVEPASALSMAVQRNGSLDAVRNSVAVFSYGCDTVIQFTLPDTRTDESNMKAIEEIVMRDVRAIAPTYGIKV